MNEVAMNVDAWASAVRAVVGQSAAETIGKVFEAIDLAERRGHSAGFDEGAAVTIAQNYRAGRNDGYKEGHEDGRSEGLNVSHAAAYDDGYEEGYADGYDTAYHIFYMEEDEVLAADFDDEYFSPEAWDLIDEATAQQHALGN